MLGFLEGDAGRVHYTLSRTVTWVMLRVLRGPSTRVVTR